MADTSGSLIMDSSVLISKLLSILKGFTDRKSNTCVCQFKFEINSIFETDK